jgi:GAF domain-containing protein
VLFEDLRPAPPPSPTATAFTTLIAALQADSAPAPETPMTACLEALLTAVPEAQWASISARSRETDPPSTPAATGEPALLADGLQYQTGEGPCLEAVRGVPAYAHGPMLAHRWPDFGSALTERTPVRAVLSLPLPGRPGVGSLNLYRAVAEPFPADAMTRVGELAAACSLAFTALALRTRVDNLEQALGTSRQIAAAVGIVMAQLRCPYDEAFAHMRAVSQLTHRKVRDLAEDILFTGALPDAPAG